jgi:hypothetical protein
MDNSKKKNLLVWNKGTNHRDIRQSVKKKDKYALAQHCHKISTYLIQSQL